MVGKMSVKMSGKIWSKNGCEMGVKMGGGSDQWSGSEWRCLLWRERYTSPSLGMG